MSAIFDWGNTLLRFQQFHEEMNIRLTRFSNDYQEQTHTLKQFAFNLFDMNCDGFICENDVVAMLNSMRTCACLPHLYKDLIIV
jgi:Ca2+-binding EF-hand superfamily protein